MAPRGCRDSKLYDTVSSGENVDLGCYMNLCPKLDLLRS